MKRLIVAACAVLLSTNVVAQEKELVAPPIPCYSEESFQKAKKDFGLKLFKFMTVQDIDVRVYIDTDTDLHVVMQVEGLHCLLLLLNHVDET